MLKIKNNKKLQEVIITIDDFTMSEGVDITSIELIKANPSIYLSSFVTNKRLSSLKKLKSDEQRSLGLHLDFTNGKAIAIKGKSLLTNNNSEFNKNFIIILFLSIFRRAKLRVLIKKEIEAQIKLLNKYIANITYINGHQHIHMIPLIWNSLNEINKKYKIPRIRFINESLLKWQILNLLNVKNTMKLVLLRILAIFCKNKSNIYFISIFNSCKLSKEVLENYKIPKKYNKIEIMLHPGNSKIDKDNKTKEQHNLTSHWRDIEKDSLLFLLNKK